MGALRSVQLQGAGHGVDNGLGGPDLAPLFQTGVVVGADPRKLRNLLTAQPGHAAGRRRCRQPRGFRPHPGTHDAQELSKLRTLTHDSILARATPRIYAEGRSAGPRTGRDRPAIQASTRNA